MKVEVKLCVVLRRDNYDWAHQLCWLFKERNWGELRAAQTAQTMPTCNSTVTRWGYSRGKHPACFIHSSCLCHLTEKSLTSGGQSNGQDSSLSWGHAPLSGLLRAKLFQVWWNLLRRSLQPRQEKPLPQNWSNSDDTARNDKQSLLPQRAFTSQMWLICYFPIFSLAM